ncbi:hypothetical protein [Micromonospora pisi]|uniref:hypothetical protein n=1 Tax=Micromonospora pisi TaxID=589240 RepID=UPI0011C3D250|nr:hypothetical protein [Micromonospora pisi]
MDPSLSVELAKHDWTAFRTFTGDASRVPVAIVTLASAESDEQAAAGYWRIDNVVVVDGRLSEAVKPVTSCLLVAMDLAPPPGRKSILDLLSVIATGYEEHVDNQVVGEVSVRTCVEMMASRLNAFIEELLASGNASCVDILLMCAVHVDGVLNEVCQAFVSALSLRSCLSIREHIEIAIDDLPQSCQ